VFAGDLFEPLPATLRGRVDLLVVNAPYVPTEAIALMPPEAREHEPHVTLDGGLDGVDVHRRVAAGAAEWLAPGGRLLVETSRQQAARTVEAFRAGGLTAEVRRAEDVDGTVVTGGRAV
jgi:release factor glutamine methyltransferase